MTIAKSHEFCVLPYGWLYHFVHLYKNWSSSTRVECKKSHGSGSTSGAEVVCWSSWPSLQNDHCKDAMNFACYHMDDYSTSSICTKTNQVQRGLNAKVTDQVQRELNVKVTEIWKCIRCWSCMLIKLTKLAKWPLQQSHQFCVLPYGWLYNFVHLYKNWSSSTRVECKSNTEVHPVLKLDVWSSWSSTQNDHCKNVINFACWHMDDYTTPSIWTKTDQVQRELKVKVTQIWK